MLRHIQYYKCQIPSNNIINLTYLYRMYLLNRMLVLLGCIFFGAHFSLIIVMLSVYCVLKGLWTLITKRQRSSLNPIYETHPDVFKNSSNLVVNQNK